MRFQSLILFLLVIPTALFGRYNQTKERWAPDTPYKYSPIYSVQEHFDIACSEFNQEHWDEALAHFLIIFNHYQESPFYADALFYTAICYYSKSEIDLANKQFDRYLSIGGKLKNFEKVFDYKLEIANFYAHGIKKHLFGIEKLPKWSSAKKDALAIYDEIISALPGKEVAAEALYKKADLLRAKKQYHEALDDLQILVRRFPKHALSAESYLRISEIYLEQSRRESQNPDLIALAQVNLQRFIKAFPSDERYLIAQGNLRSMKEVFAESLYDTGRFYERKKKHFAAMIYYQDTLLKYPETNAAQKCRKRLDKQSFSSQAIVKK